MENFDRSLFQNENFDEIFLTENFNGTWTPRQLLSMAEEFNDLPMIAVQRRQIILNRFFHATAISMVIVNKLSFIAEDALRIYFHHTRLNELHQRKYEVEPKLLGAIERTDDDGYQIKIEHLMKTDGFCHCVKLHHRETMHVIPLEKIISLKMQPDEKESFELHLEIAK